jgi:hypothetical protein
VLIVELRVAGKVDSWKAERSVLVKFERHMKKIHGKRLGESLGVD